MDQIRGAASLFFLVRRHVAKKQPYRRWIPYGYGFTGCSLDEGWVVGPFARDHKRRGRLDIGGWLDIPEGKKKQGAAPEDSTSLFNSWLPRGFLSATGASCPKIGAAFPD